MVNILKHYLILPCDIRKSSVNCVRRNKICTFFINMMSLPVAFFLNVHINDG